MKTTFIAALLLLACVCADAQNGLLNLPKENSWYKIRVVQTNKYLGAENGSIDDGAAIVQSDWADKHSQRFLARKNKDGSWSFQIGHSDKLMCAEKGDGSEGDRIIQRRDRVHTGKWVLNTDLQTGCLKGWKLQYKDNFGKPMQLAGNGFQLVEQKYQDGSFDCAYTYLFEEVGAPGYRENARPVFYKPGNTEKKKKPIQ